MFVADHVFNIINIKQHKNCFSRSTTTAASKIYDDNKIIVGCNHDVSGIDNPVDNDDDDDDNADNQINLREKSLKIASSSSIEFVSVSRC